MEVKAIINSFEGMQFVIEGATNAKEISDFIKDFEARQKGRDGVHYQGVLKDICGEFEFFFSERDFGYITIMEKLANLDPDTVLSYKQVEGDLPKSYLILEGKTVLLEDFQDELIKIIYKSE